MARFRKRPVIVDAVCLKHKVTVKVPGGRVKGSPGDWLITGVAGERAIVPDVIFRAIYDPVNDEAQKMMEG